MLERTRAQSPFYTPSTPRSASTCAASPARDIAPFAHAWEEAAEFPRELYDKAAAIGLVGLGFPEEYGGGRRRSSRTRGLAKSWCSPAPAASREPGATASACRRSSRSAERREKPRFMPPVLRGEKIAALAITEPGGGSDVAMRTTARRDGDHYVVNGEKTFITSGCRAD